MADNPSTTPTADTEAPRDLSRTKANLLLGTLKYIGAYLLGVIACAVYCVLSAALPHTLRFADLFGVYEFASLIRWSIPGLYVFLATLITAFPVIFLHYWGMTLVALLLFACGVYTLFRRTSAFRFWRPLWIGFPIGFFGALDSSWMAVTSIP